MNGHRFVVLMLVATISIGLCVWISGPPMAGAGGPQPPFQAIVRAPPSKFDQVTHGPIFIHDINIGAPSLPSALRLRLRGSTDYAALVKSIEATANAGDAEAQFVIAHALRYCADTMRIHFLRSGAKIRTIDEVRSRRAGQSAGTSQNELDEIYARCHGFLEDGQNLAGTAAWSDWLDRSARSGCPAAMAERAEILKTDLMLATASGTPRRQAICRLKFSILDDGDRGQR